MGDLVKSGGNGLVGLLHGKGGELSIPKPFEKDIFLFDTYVAGTTHIEGIEELEPHLNNDDRLEFFREPDNRYDNQAIVIKTVDAYTREQIARYDRMSAAVAASLPYSVIRHTANSAAIERFPEARFDMCRLGLGLYGFGWEHNAGLRPVSALKTRIVQIKRLEAGDAVGYGRAGKLLRPTVTATVPIGYADGLDRHLGCGRWSMCVAGRPAPIVGRVCMDSCMIDITDIPGVGEGDEVTVFSAEPGNDLETMARVLDTIPYEIMTSVSSRVKRIYLKE